MEGTGSQSEHPSGLNKLGEWLNSPAMQELRQSFEEYHEETMREDNEWWEGLSYEDKLKAFRSVCRRIHEGDVEKRGSYRYVLYDTFGFDMDAYLDGMDCGYLAIHNLIWQGIESEQGRVQRCDNDQLEDKNIDSL